MSSPCAIEANPDLYGFGIRLGFYLSWAASQISVLLGLGSTTLDVWDGSLLLSCAVIIAILFTTNAATARAYPIEIVIMLYLHVGNHLSVHHASNSNGGDLLSAPLTGWRTLLALFSASGISIYSIWFWIHGVTSHNFLGNEDNSNCTPRVFLFANVSGKSIAVRTIMTITVCVRVFFTGLSLVEIITNMAKRVQSKGWRVLLTLSFMGAIRDEGKEAAERKKEIAEKSYRMAQRRAVLKGFKSPNMLQRFNAWWEEYFGDVPESAELDNIHIPEAEAKKVWERHLRHQNFRTIATRMFCMGFYVAGVELMLFWNNIKDTYSVESVGQLIPFVIGILGFVKVFADAIELAKDRSKERANNEMDAGSPSGANASVIHSSETNDAGNQGDVLVKSSGCDNPAIAASPRNSHTFERKLG